MTEREQCSRSFFGKNVKIFRIFAAGMALSLVVAVALPLWAIEAKVVTPRPEYGRVAELFSRKFSRAHLTRADMDDLRALRAFERFISSLDYDHVYFMADDIDRMSRQAEFLDDSLKEGNVDFAYTVFQLFKERVNNRFAHLKKLMESEFDVNREETYRRDRKEAAWADGEAEWDELWRRKIKKEYLQRLVRKELADLEREKALKEREAREEEQDADADPDRAESPQTDTDSGDGAVQDADDEPAETEPEAGDDAAAEPPPTPRESVLKQYTQFVTILNDYEEEWVLQRYLSAFAHAYDPHSDYMSPSRVSDFRIEMKLSLVGIGALLRADDGAAEIIRLIPGGPAERDGTLKPGDRIIGVAQGDGDPQDTLHWPLSKTVQLIRGEKGTVVTLIVIPAGDQTGTMTKAIKITRDVVKLEEQAAKGKVHEIKREDGDVLKLGVIQLSAFYVDLKAKSDQKGNEEFRSSVRDVARLIEEMARENIDGLILDLRTNGGGSLLEAVEMTGLFIRTGPVVQVRERRRTTVLPDNDPLVAYSGPMIVLVNRLSASASEILAGALQDYGRALIVGDTTTHGKGTVQTVMQLDRRDEEMGSIKVTTASFYRIRGGSTQLRGIIADVVLPSDYAGLDVGEASLENPLPWDSVAPVPFQPHSNLRAMIPGLRKKSETRRSNSEAFAKRSELLDRVSELRELDEISLRYEDIRETAQTERDLIDLRREYTKDNEENGTTGGDILLGEALQILADLIEEQERLKAAMVE